MSENKKAFPLGKALEWRVVGANQRWHTPKRIDLLGRRSWLESASVKD
jgi:hypothetical protein